MANTTTTNQANLAIIREGETLAYHQGMEIKVGDEIRNLSGTTQTLSIKGLGEGLGYTATFNPDSAVKVNLSDGNLLLPHSKTIELQLVQGSVDLAPLNPEDAALATTASASTGGLLGGFGLIAAGGAGSAIGGLASVSGLMNDEGGSGSTAPFADQSSEGSSTGLFSTSQSAPFGPSGLLPPGNQGNQFDQTNEPQSTDASSMQPETMAATASKDTAGSPPEASHNPLEQVPSAAPSDASSTPMPSDTAPNEDLTLLQSTVSTINSSATTDANELTHQVPQLGI